MRRLFLILFIFCLLPRGTAQIQLQLQPDQVRKVPAPVGLEVEKEQVNTLYESVVFPDRSLSRRLEQADRLYEAGRNSEAAQMLGSILETADFAFIVPEKSSEEGSTNPPARTLRLTVNDYIIDRLRKLPKESRDSYAFQYEPTARRLLENAAAAGSLDDIQEIARKYFPTPSGASAAFLVGLTQFERGDYAAASLTLTRLKEMHPAIPDVLKPALDQMLAETLNKRENVTEQPVQDISESAWLEQIGWRIPPGVPAQNSDTKASAPLLEQNWTVPVFSQLHLERETDTLTRTMKSLADLYLPASQPLVVSNLFITRTLRETIAVDANSGKRIWIAPTSEYRFPGDSGIQVPQFSVIPRTTLRLFLWHDRITQQLSSDGERLFGIDEHNLQGNFQLGMGRVIPNLQGRGDDRRFDPGNTLTARDLHTGRVLWQVGKFPYVQKYIDALFASTQRGPVNVDESIFTDDEKTLKETWFLGAPLPLHGRLYVIGETDGVLSLFVLDSQTGRLIARQSLAHVSDSLATSVARRTYPLFPSASEGIVICPTGNGLMTALDATTLAPIWCFSYAALRTPNPDDRNARNMLLNQQRMLAGGNVPEQVLKQIFDASGWQVPCIMIDGQRVLAAPPDQPNLYCLDLLTGKLHWELSVSRTNSLYVAAIHSNKAFLVTPVNVMTIDLETGKNLTVDSPTAESRFPASMKPTGVGVRSGSQYFIPFTEGHLAVLDLDTSKLNWLNASGMAMLPPTEPITVTPSTYPAPVSPIFQVPGITPAPSGLPSVASPTIFTPDLAGNDIFQKTIQFGNLVGIKGRFFSQSPTQIASFDQKEPLRQRAEMLLGNDANDPEGLLQQGRILKSEGKLAEAIDAFRSSLKAKPSLEAADYLRKNLLEAMRSDYPTWSHAGQELESLAEVPDDWGAILYAQVEGVLQSGRIEDIVTVLEKVFAFGPEQSVLIPVSGDHSTQLHRALGCLVEQSITRGNRPGLRAAWGELAETFLQRLSSGELTSPASATGGGLTSPAFTLVQPSQWMRNTVILPPEVQRWSAFVNIFRGTVAANKAKGMLREEYERHRLPLALDLLERPLTIPAWSELIPPLDWGPGKMDMDVREVTALATNVVPPGQNEVDQNVERLLIIARNPGVQRTMDNQAPLPFLGPTDSEHAAFNHSLKLASTGGFFFCRSDFAGRELWRLALPTTIVSGYQDNQSGRFTGEYTTYLKGFHNLLLLVHGTSVTAIDTTPLSEKILWSKTLSSVPVSQQTGVRMNNPQQRLNVGTPFPKNAVFVSPHAVCFWDVHSVYGLDPLTGQTLWVRRVLYENCTILGDENHLFLVFPDASQVVALDPASGKELVSAPLPFVGGMCIYETKIIFVHGSGNEYALYISDLREIYEDRRRALQIADSPNGSLTSAVPREVLHDKLNNTMCMVQTFRNDRFLSVANWATKSLQVYDLHTKKKLLPEENKMLEFVTESGINQSRARCDVELVGDRFLVLFTKDTQIRNVSEPETDIDGRSYRRTYQQIPGISQFSINEGLIMLFDAEGKPCWEKPTVVEKTGRPLDVPDHMPFMLFAVFLSQTEVSTNKNGRATRVMAVDKRTGEFRFRKHLDGDQSPLQMFRVSADPEAREIIFSSPTAYPPRVTKAVFMKENASEQ